MLFDMSKRTLAIGAVIVLAAGGWFLFGRGGEDQQARGRGQGERVVVGAIVQKEEFADRLEAIGTLYANESVTLTAKTQGIIRSLDFEDGQTFRKGEQIAAVDAGEQDAALNVELANLEQQRKELARIEQLVAEKHVSQAKLDEQMALLKRAEANVAAARVRSGDRRIVAPFAGIVGTRRISVGALVSPGTTIATLDDISEVKLDFSIPETFLSSLKPGLDIESSASAYPGEVFKGRVIAVDSRVDPVTRSVSVRAAILNEDARLRPGMLMVVELIKDRRESLMIPQIALMPENDMHYVMAINPDNTVRKLKVVIGRRKVGSVEILDGLKEGDLVVAEGTLDLRDGARIRLSNAAQVRPGKPAPANENLRHPG